MVYTCGDGSGGCIYTMWRGRLLDGMVRKMGGWEVSQRGSVASMEKVVPLIAGVRGLVLAWMSQHERN